MDKKIRHVVISGLIASIYAALTYLSAALGLAYGQVQIRLSEALCVLCAFTPAATPGLTIGCFIGNISSSLGWMDMLVGTAATFISALIGRSLRYIKIKGIPVLLPLPFIVVNMIAVGAETAFLSGGNATVALFAINSVLIGAGQTISCYMLGLPLYIMIKRSPLAKTLADND